MKKAIKSESIYNVLGVDERALIDKIKIKLLRKIFIRIFGVKLRLQWTGWLQYLIPVPFAILLFLIGGLIYLLGEATVAGIFSVLALLLTLRIVFDIITIKFRIRPAEAFPKRNDDKNVFDLMRLRRSCRSFQTRKLRKTDLDELMDSVRKHTTKSKLSNKAIRLEYISSPVKVWPVVNASEFLVAIAPKEYDRLAVIDTGRALQKVVIDAVRMGLSTCWIGPGADHKSVISSLGNRFHPEHDNIICVCAVGYKSWFTPLFIQIFNMRMHRRLPLTSLFFSDFEMSNPLKLNSRPFKIFGRTFEACQWAPSSYNNQTTRCIGVQDRNGRLTRFDFYAVTASRYYAAVATGIWCANWEIGCEALNLAGKFKLPADHRKKAKIPGYDISWVLEKPV